MRAWYSHCAGARAIFLCLTFVAWCTTECFAEGQHRSAGETSDNFFNGSYLLFVQLTRPRRNWLGNCRREKVIKWRQTSQERELARSSEVQKILSGFFEGNWKMVEYILWLNSQFCK